MISLIHPSYGRPEQAIATYHKWIAKSSKTIQIEHILSIDNGDADKAKYLSKYAGAVLNDTDNVVAATNKAAKQSKGDILIYLSDDFDCPNNWDVLVANHFEGHTQPMLLKVNDALQQFNVKVLTIPIMNRELYNLLGNFWHPSYRSMHVDEDLFQVCERLPVPVGVGQYVGCIKLAPELVFEHQHYCIGKAAHDNTYKRSESNWNHGASTFQSRGLQNFTPNYR